MANFLAIHSVGSSLVTYLRNAYPPLLREEHTCDFRLFSSGELAQLEDGNMNTTVSLYLHRITLNEHLRNNLHPNQPSDSFPPLSVDLHYLITIWADSPVAEHSIAAWVMHEFHHHPIMDISSLSSDGGWMRDDVVQIIPAELSNEDMMRIWDSLAPSYRLSLSYIGRAIRIEPENVPPGQPVVATQFQYEATARKDNDGNE